MTVFDGYLFVGTGGIGQGTCEVYRYDGDTWTLVNTTGFGNPTSDSVFLAVNQGRLYAGTGDFKNHKGLVLRYNGGESWTPVSTPGFGIGGEVTTLASYNGKVYAGVFRKADVKSYVYRWDGPGASDWTMLAYGSFGGTTGSILSSAVFDGRLYMGTDAGAGTGAEIWRWDGSEWTQANTDGFGESLNDDVPSLLVSGNTLYAGVENQYYGAQIWRTTSSDNFYFAEGTTRPGFDPYFTIANPGDAAAEVTISYMLGNGKSASQGLTVAAHSRATAHPPDILGVADDAAHDFSAKVECTNGLEISVERPMYFDYNGVWTGGHDVVGFH
jgi:hypothetical protein